MEKGTKILNKNDVKHIEMLLAKGLRPEDIAEVIGTSKTTVRRVKDGTHYLLRKDKEKAAEEALAAAEEADEETLRDIIKNQTVLIQNTETIIQLLRQYLSEWRVN